MELIPCRKNELKRLRRLYKAAFPAEERAPFSLLYRRHKQRRAELLCAREDGEFAGLVYTVTHKDLAYLFYLAVDEEKRGQGLGTKILSEIKNKYEGRRLFLARETLDKTAKNCPEREKRREFYMKNGFSDLNSRIREGFVVYDVMGIGGRVSPEEYAALITRWSGKLRLKFIKMELFENEN